MAAVFVAWSQVPAAAAAPRFDVHFPLLEEMARNAAINRINAMTAPPQPLSASTVYARAVRGIARIVVTFRIGDNEVRSVGTGFIVDTRGDIATNCHVLSPDGATAPRVTVEFADDTQPRPAQMLGCDTAGDVGVVRVAGLDATRPMLSFARPGSYHPGDSVIAIGYADDLPGDPSVSRGIISALHRWRVDDGVSDLIQTDATINHGNSGGPLLDMYGQVVGINTYTSATRISTGDMAQAVQDGDDTVPVGGEINIYYARSSLTAESYVEQIIARGEVERTDFGLEVGFFDPSMVRLPRPAVLIKSVTPGSLGDRLGLKAGFYLSEIDWPNGFRLVTASPGALEDAEAFIANIRSPVTLFAYTLDDAAADAVLSGSAVPAAGVKWTKTTFTAAVPLVATR